MLHALPLERQPYMQVENSRSVVFNWNYVYSILVSGPTRAYDDNYHNG